MTNNNSHKDIYSQTRKQNASTQMTMLQFQHPTIGSIDLVPHYFNQLLFSSSMLYGASLFSA